jgi:hypothetical protein
MGKPHGLGTVRITAQATLYGARERYLDLVGISTDPNASEVTSRAREAFRIAMIRHHNDSVQTPKLAQAASIWEIPRLAALREIIEWDRRPSREATRAQSLESFKQRMPLPSPFAVQGKPAPNVDAGVPPRPAPRLPAPPPPPLEQSEQSGTIVRFANTGIKLRIAGGGEIVVPVDPRIFPTAVWRRLHASAFLPGTAVRITMLGSRVIRVIPEVNR